MYLRIFSISALGLALASCGTEIETPEPEGDGIECAVGAGSEFSNVCTLERISDSEFVIHHPDGGFRRLAETAEGLKSADGAHEVRIAEAGAGDSIEIEVDMDRYRIPSSGQVNE